MDLDDLIAILDFPVQRKTVSESGASTAGHVHPEVRVLGGSQRLARLRVVPLDELLDLVRSRFCERDLNHRHSPCLAKTITPLFNPLCTVFATLTDRQKFTSAASPCIAVPRGSAGSRTHGGRARSLPPPRAGSSGPRVPPPNRLPSRRAAFRRHCPGSAAPPRRHTG